MVRVKARVVGLWSVLFLGCLAAVTLWQGHSVSAIVYRADCDGQQGIHLVACRNARNITGERYSAREICPQTGNCGALWLSAPTASYFDDTIPVLDADARVVRLMLRGSTTRIGGSGANAWATGIDVTQDGTKLVQGAFIYRGDTSKIPHGVWTSQQVNHPQRETPVDLFVGNVPPGQTRHITLTINRCFSRTPYGKTGKCALQELTVTVKKKPAPWKVQGQSYVTNHTARSGRQQPSVVVKPGDRVSFDHDLRNNSTTAMERNVSINIDHADVPLGSHPTGRNLPYGPQNLQARGGPGQLFFQQYGMWPHAQTNRLITQEDVGKRICQRVAWTPAAGEGGGWGASGWACADVVYSYELTPTINLYSAMITEGEKSVSGLSARIDNSGITQSKKAHYAVIRFVVRGNDTTAIAPGDGVKVPRHPNNAAQLIDDWPCEIARQIGGRSGLTIDAGGCTGKELSRHSDADIARGGIDITDLKLPDDISGLKLTKGDRLCYATVVGPYNGAVSDDTFRYSVDCASIAKTPKLQVWGGDVRSGGNIITSRTVADQATYGSWGEYGLLAAHKIDSASGAGLSSDAGGRLAVGPAAQYNQLTFANTRRFGFYATDLVKGEATTPTIGSPRGGLQGSVAVGSLASGSYTADNLTLQASDLPAGRSVLIQASGTVKISGNLQYAGGPYQSWAALPQLIIRARHIVIDPSVSTVNAWLMTPAQGSVSTCGALDNPHDWLSGLSVKDCNNQLQLHGPVMTGRFYPRRVFGAEQAAGSHRGTPAEIINLRYDSYFWGQAHAVATGAIRNMYVRELPPRF